MDAPSLNSYLVANPVTKKINPDSRSYGALFLTSSEHKIREYKEFMKTYGTTNYFRNSPEQVTEIAIAKLLGEMNPTPHYILREESKLFDAAAQKEVSGLDILTKPEQAPKLLLNQARVKVWVPQWDEKNQLNGITCREFNHEIAGSINPDFKDKQTPEVFGWDHLFVNAATGKTNQETSTSPWGKQSARQMVLSDFVTTNLFYKQPKNLTHHVDLKPTQAVEFTEEMSVSGFMRRDPCLSNPHLGVWGLDKLKTKLLNEGEFFKAGTSRPLNNYFSPPFGGIPIVPKKSFVEETVFMFHDLGHHNIPDLIPTGDFSLEQRHVYTAWRMMSEAMTICLADMFYANTLERTNKDWVGSLDTRIYPLFKATKFDEIVTAENRDEIMTKILRANVAYAVLGDDSEWRKLVKEGGEAKIEAYKAHFGKFFIGDHVWTHANFSNMAKHQEYYEDWSKLVDPEHYAQANLILLDDVVTSLKARGVNLNSFEATVWGVFEAIIRSRFFDKQPIVELTDKQRQENAFRRYMIGQLSFYPRFKDLPGMMERGKQLADKIKLSPHLGPEVRKQIRDQFEKDVRYVWGQGCITADAAMNYMQVHPVFPPVYINYNKQECKTVSEVVNKLFGGHPTC